MIYPAPLTNGTRYCFRVRAKNANGESGPSAAVAATPVAPAVMLGASAITQTKAVRMLTISNHTGAWYYRQTVPSTGTRPCTSRSASQTTASLMNLSGGTAYTFKAYSDSNCTSANELTSATTDADFTTLDLTANSVTHNSATLTISGHIADWWYRKTSPTPAGTCTKVDAGTSAASLSSLTANAAHTFKAYSASTCANAAELASETFTTSAAPATPMLGASAITQTKATLTISNHTGAWYYRQTVPATGTRPCTSRSASQTTASLTNLSGGTAYTFKAYSDSNCTSANELTSTTTDADFTTLDLAATSITQSGATLTLSGATAPSTWYYKADKAPHNSCSTGLTGAATLSSLTAGTSYTYKAYSDSTCTTAGELASETFSTSTATLSGPTLSKVTYAITNRYLPEGSAAWRERFPFLGGARLTARLPHGASPASATPARRWSTAGTRAPR